MKRWTTRLCNLGTTDALDPIFFGDVVVCSVGYLAVSLPSTHWKPEILTKFSSHDKKKRLQTLPKVPWEENSN